MLRSYFRNRCQRVLWNRGLSEPFTLNMGVSQGSMLRPILFMIHVNPLGLLKVFLYADGSFFVSVAQAESCLRDGTSRTMHMNG